MIQLQKWMLLAGMSPMEVFPVTEKKRKQLVGTDKAIVVSSGVGMTCCYL